VKDFFRTSQSATHLAAKVREETSFGEAQHYTLLDIPWFRILESSGGLGINFCGYPFGSSQTKKAAQVDSFFKNIFELFYCFTIVLLLI
jgi:hypothetical protein